MRSLKPHEAMAVEQRARVKTWLEIGNGYEWIQKAEDPPFNALSFCPCTDLVDLADQIFRGGWCLGQAFFLDNICFINQIDGGDEWLTIKDGTPFESITMQMDDETPDQARARLFGFMEVHRLRQIIVLFAPSRPSYVEIHIDQRPYLTANEKGWIIPDKFFALESKAELDYFYELSAALMEAAEGAILWIKPSGATTTGDEAPEEWTFKIQLMNGGFYSTINKKNWEFHPIEPGGPFEIRPLSDAGVLT